MLLSSSHLKGPAPVLGPLRWGKQVQGGPSQKRSPSSPQEPTSPSVPLMPSDPRWASGGSSNLWVTFIKKIACDFRGLN